MSNSPYVLSCSKDICVDRTLPTYLLLLLSVVAHPVSKQKPMSLHVRFHAFPLLVPYSFSSDFFVGHSIMRYCTTV